MDVADAMYPRYVASDTRLGDVDLSAGTRVGVLLASANRDERHWQHPDRCVAPRSGILRSPAGRTSVSARSRSSESLAMAAIAALDSLDGAVAGV
ncbi:MAG: cytochrome P450 [Solirubrobacteraceae bacterium]